MRRRGAALAALLMAGCGDGTAADPQPVGGRDVHAPPRPVLIVSGKDDHGLLADAHVALLAAPRFAARTVAEVDDGTLVRVLLARGEWHRVSTLDTARRTGWIHDFSLRGTAHVRPLAGCAAPVSAQPGTGAHARLAANVQVEMLGAVRARGVLWVRVRPREARRAGGWVRRDALDELPDHARCVRAPSR